MIKFRHVSVVTFLSLVFSLYLPSNSPGRTQIKQAMIDTPVSLSSPDALVPTQAFIPGDTSIHKAVKEYGIQVGAFAIKNNALRLQRRIRAAGYRVDVYENLIDGKQLLYLVWVGVYLSEEAAQPDLAIIKSKFEIEGVIRPRSISRR